ncbi:MAG TPA: hypothetical protein VM659_20380 [Dongiaceae bacterium]|nr:hypothetical protein [Dongiaceae bacterium]
MIDATMYQFKEESCARYLHAARDLNDASDRCACIDAVLFLSSLYKAKKFAQHRISGSIGGKYHSVSSPLP